jgi:hypothetical protein
MRCEQAQDQLSDYLDQALSAPERQALDAHMAECADCRRELEELRLVTELLHAVPAEPMPEMLPNRIFAALAALPDEAPQPATAGPIMPVIAPQPEGDRPTVLAQAPVAAPAPWWKRMNLPSAMAGAVAAAALLFVWNIQSNQLPNIETVAVQQNQDVAVNIGFDVAQNVEDVTFQVDLPEGLQFVDDKHQPLLAQSVSWKGSLKTGKTVVPIVVRGVQPGKWTIEAYVRKGPMLRKTTIVMPVSAS